MLYPSVVLTLFVDCLLLKRYSYCILEIAKIHETPSISLYPRCHEVPGPSSYTHCRQKRCSFRQLSFRCLSSLLPSSDAQDLNIRHPRSLELHESSVLNFYYLDTILQSSKHLGWYFAFLTILSHPFSIFSIGTNCSSLKLKTHNSRRLLGAKPLDVPPVQQERSSQGS